MKAYEFPAKVTPEGTVELPDQLHHLATSEHSVRVILLVDEFQDEEERSWSRLTAEHFLAGYSEDDAIYDEIK
jgi:hypothetical protein